MSWIIVGDDETAVLACNTSGKAFGPLHTSYSPTGNARDELREFGKQLDKDPRQYPNPKLREKYTAWRREKVKEI